MSSAIRPVREITAEEENFRLESLEGTPASFVKRDAVEPEPVGTYIVMVFQITGYDQDCDGSLMMRANHVDKDGKNSGWEVSHLGLYPEVNLVVESPQVLWDLC